MFVEGYHLSFMKWSYPDIYSFDCFLKDFKSELNISNIEDNLEFLGDYRDKLREHAVTLNFGNCKLKVQGIDEAVAQFEGLEYVLERL
ncbi:hypothetical protein CW357_07090 [Rummeliibacillus sp. TYF005]|uniref:hypothetical protein n=1 Tax=unclassified Rummeliibacillus TaxID=2622809 RepID=UPI000E664A4A|nr:MULTISPECIES: hypothetical protein [unclassified Rummeliibacillus]RIJ63339.1 hypothetical protein D1606_15545 [Rummeliibacillus sp. POC4]RPJ96106.1 hypothetical protein CW357_07090 [Rummeliibacillus sp. TYF005]